MKTVVRIVVVFLFAGATLPAQDFFPLQKGNKWLYKESVDYQNQRTVLGYYTMEVIGDTILPNGKKYYVFDRSLGILGYFARVDSNRVYYFQGNSTEVLIFDFTASVGQSWPVNNDGARAFVLGKGLTVVFGDSTMSIGFYVDGLVAYIFYFAEKYGPTFIGSSRESQVAYYNDELQGAVLNGVTYGNLSSVELISSLVPNHTQLHANYPNPFNAETNVQFSINYPTNISLIVYDLIGRKVAILHEGAIEPGLYRTRWKPDGVSTGIYILRLQTSTNSFEKKVLYLK